MNEEVYVSWYKKVVEGTIVKREDLFGMVAVSIPIQGVQSTALFQPDHVYKSMQEACGEYPVHYPTPAEMIHPALPGESVAKVIKEAIDEARKIQEDDGYAKLQQFKVEHWNHERNMLQLDYWQEYDKMFHAYMRKRLGKDEPQQVEMVNTVIPSTDVTDPNDFAREWIKGTKDMKIEHPETEEEAATWKKPEETTVAPRTPYTVTELTLF